MKTARRSIGMMLCAMALLNVVVGYAEEPLQRFQASRYLMGTQFGIALYATDQVTAERAFDVAFKRIEALETSLSDYDPDSELSQLSAASPTTSLVRVGDDLWKMLTESQSLSEQTEGAFDITIGPLTKLWRRSRKTKSRPDSMALAEARKAVGYGYVKLHKDSQSVELLQPNMRLDLGGIAKGFAGDEALRLIQATTGIKSILVSSGGGLSLGEPPPGETGWRIGLAGLDLQAEPIRTVRLSRCGVATAGDASQFIEIDGRRYSHILDPRTGEPLQSKMSVTVIAPNGLIADALDTPVNIMGAKAGLEFIKNQTQVSALITWEDEQGVHTESVRMPL